ncbi:MAG TPA: KamA family radical SAM protein [Mesotoga prima]|nr:MULTISPECIES: KamA family radical SAM protein [Mesotoga]HNQ71331.1 KamA family radical SAM protein [Mesotoga prima]HOP38091.1 KamA family radical SAM protein [Mesotoga prima]HPE53295.1 KamA family radical SAM protein [Mesotoga prima]HPJ32288.1 KamA family radical SAM protein [Mesotoga prima]HPQ91762.1 KamA family radical SAM protein [Mesotoga prima]
MIDLQKPTYLTSVEKIEELNDEQISEMKKVTDVYPFRANDYYLGLINWNDPHDPIKRIILPDFEELDEWGDLDASQEHKYTVAPGMEHKYKDTALLLVSKVCGSFCRFCFRKRLFSTENKEVVNDVTLGVEYIRKHKEITNVLLTGGDSLILSTEKLGDIVRQLREIDHVGIIRFGSKMVAFNPYRIINDPDLPEMVKKYSTPKKRIYIMAHFNHPRELTDEAIRGLNILRDAGAVICNQTPMIRGVNDSVDVMTALFRKLSFIGIPPYYVFQCRPTKGNHTYAVPAEKGYEIFKKSIDSVSGLAKRARFVMSHATGKIEYVGLDEKKIYMKYHRAADPKRYDLFMAFDRNPDAYWLDDYVNPDSLV